MTATTEKTDNVLHVKMLGGYSMSFGGKTIAGHSRSSISQNNALLQILIHAREKGVARYRLEELLFGDREVDNAHHSLRSVIYNAKKFLEKAGLPKVNYIYSERDVFYWCREIQVEEDACEFERLYNEARKEADPARKLDSYLKACYQYGGEFLPMQTNYVWVVRESMRYEEMFSDCVEQAAELLRGRKDFTRMKDLGQYASIIAPLSDWESLTMEALVRMCRYDEAVRLYESTVKYYLEELGIRPSGKLTEWFEHLARGISHRNSALLEVQRELEGTGSPESGACLCSYPVFQGIYRANKGLIERTGGSSCLMLCTILDSKGNPMKSGTVLDRLSERMIESACRSLRPGDAVCSFGKGQCLFLLTDTTEEECSMIRQRINNCFVVGRQRISIHFEVTPVLAQDEDSLRKTS